MKKSLRQLMLVGLSATLLASVAAPVVVAQDDATEDTTEQVEEVEETEETDMTEEETVEEETTAEEDATEETDAQASEVQQGVDEALAVYESMFPQAAVEEIEVELDLEETVYTIFVRGFDDEDNDYELEAEWAEGEIKTQEYNEDGIVSDGDSEADQDGDQTDEADDSEAIDEDLLTDDSELPDDAEELEDSPLTEDVEVTDEAETEAAEETEAQTDEQDRLQLDLESLIDIDEASDIALEEAGSGEIDHWILSADTTEWWNLFGDEENDNPVWTLNVVNMDEDSEDVDLMDELEVQINAVSGDVLNQEDLEEETDATTEETEMTEEAADGETVEETTVE